MSILRIGGIVSDKAIKICGSFAHALTRSTSYSLLLEYMYATLYILPWEGSYMGHVKRKSVFEHAQNVPFKIHPTHARSLIHAFALH